MTAPLQKGTVMNSVNKTLYIPLYGKALVSKKGLFLRDETAEEIWDAEGFALRGKSASKWLAYYMGMRAAVFDSWLQQHTADADENTAVLHIGCGLDSRVQRVQTQRCMWYDIDFPSVIAERGRYFSETEHYKMIAADVRSGDWLQALPKAERAVVVMEGVSMYLTPEENRALFAALAAHFGSVFILADWYTTLAAKLTRYKNPINDVGVTQVFGIDDPAVPESDGVAFAAEHSMTPQHLIDALTGSEKRIFQKLYAGSFSKKLYRLYEYRSTQVL